MLTQSLLPEKDRYLMCLMAACLLAASSACWATDRQDAQVMYREGNAKRHAGQYAEAITIYDRVIEVAPDHYNAHLNRGVAYEALGQLDQAISNYDTVIELVPDLWKGWYNRGLVFTDQGQNRNAIDELLHK